MTPNKASRSETIFLIGVVLMAVTVIFGGAVWLIMGNEV